MIKLYGKTGCDNCDKAKEKMAILDMPYKYYDIENIMKLHNGWRDDNSVDVMACYHQSEQLPIFVIFNKAFNYAEAMSVLKRLKAVQKEIMEE
jgi:glutaredoxin